MARTRAQIKTLKESTEALSDMLTSGEHPELKETDSKEFELLSKFISKITDGGEIASVVFKGEVMRFVPADSMFSGS